MSGADQMQPPDQDIDVHHLAEMRNTGAAHTVLDIREPQELAVCVIDGSITVPMQRVPEALDGLPRETPLIIVCHHGVRSAMVTAFLRRNGFDNALNLAGGIDAWARHVDPDMARY